jgi:hypothetical protein
MLRYARIVAAPGGTCYQKNASPLESFFHRNWFLKRHRPHLGSRRTAIARKAHPAVRFFDI